MTTFIHSFIHLAYTISLLAVLVLVILNISIPISLQWPAYCIKTCPLETTFYEQCKLFCEFHDCLYEHLKSDTQITLLQIKNLLQRGNPVFVKLINVPPSWFIALNILLVTSSMMSVLLWIATLVSDALVEVLAPYTRMASAVIFSIFTAHLYFAFADDVLDLNHTLGIMGQYTQQELAVSLLLYAFPFLQVFVIRTVLSRQRYAYEYNNMVY